MYRLLILESLKEKLFLLVSEDKESEVIKLLEESELSLSNTNAELLDAIKMIDSSALIPRIRFINYV